MSDLFRWFLLTLRFSATNSGTEKSDDFHWIVWKKYFQKKNYKYEILNHLYFGPSFVFLETALGCFSKCFFLIFLLVVNHGNQHFYLAPTIKKASCGTVVHHINLLISLLPPFCFAICVLHESFFLLR